MKSRTHRTHARKMASWMMLLLATTFWGCGADNDQDANTDQEKPQAQVEAEAQPPAPKDGLEELVGSMEGDLGSQAMSWLEANSGQGHVTDLLNRKFKNDPYVLRSVLKAVYLGGSLGVGEEGVHLGLVEGAGLSKRGKKVLEVLEASEDHGLDPTRYHLGRLKAKVKELGEQRQGMSQQAWSLTEADRQTLVSALREKGLTSKTPNVRQKAMGVILGEGSPLPTLRQKGQALQEKLDSSSQEAAKLEVMLADGLATYAWDMHFSNQAWFEDDLFPSKNTKGEDNEVLRGLLAKALRESVEGDFDAFLEGLAPSHAPYQRLVQGYARYRDIVANGGWKKLRVRNMHKGSKGKQVLELKERLKAEGFFEGPMNEEFGEALEQAMISYQETHQLEADGKTHKWFWKSINVTAEERLAQIKLNLTRWHQSRIGHDNYYVRVNIPDFHAEVWKDGELDYRFRVVVGNRKLECDRKKKRLLPVNATPLFSDEIEVVILNPYWNVPERMLRDEILPAWYKDETYLEKHGYECVKGEGYECTQMRQKSGEDNALGQVKFIFPNKHSVYMHDTPKKQLFKYPTRAFSHGCMRVHEPLKFAEYLLTQDGSWDEKSFQRQLGTGVESGIRLKKTVPIHIEYMTARADEQGRVHFLSDIYRYDREELEGKSYGGRECEPEPLALPPGEEEELAEGEEGAEGGAEAGAEGGAAGGAEAGGEQGAAGGEQGAAGGAAPQGVNPKVKDILKPQKLRTIKVPPVKLGRKRADSEDDGIPDEAPEKDVGP